MNNTEILTLGQDILKQYGLDIKGWKITFDTAKKRGGACHYRTKTISLSKAIMATATDAEIRETILHETAHALTPGHSHDHVWKSMLISMGGTGARTHNMEVPKGRYEMYCSRCESVIGYRHQKQGMWKYATATNGYFGHKGCKGAYKPGASVYLRDTKNPRPEVAWTQVPGAATGVMTAPWTPPAIAASKPAKKPSTTTEGPECRCACGGHTKGGKYLPGHDARHVKQVFDAWLNNQYDATSALEVFTDSPALAGKLQKRIAEWAKSTYKD